MTVRDSQGRKGKENESESETKHGEGVLPTFSHVATLWLGQTSSSTEGREGAR